MSTFNIKELDHPERLQISHYELFIIQRFFKSFMYYNLLVISRKRVIHKLIIRVVDY